MKLDLVPPQWQTSRAREREKREERERGVLCHANLTRTAEAEGCESKTSRTFDKV